MVSVAGGTISALGELVKLDWLSNGGGAIALEFTIAQPEASAIAIGNTNNGDSLPNGMRLLAEFGMCVMQQ